MKPIRPSLETLKSATDAVVEFALIAFQMEFLRWTPSVNCTIAAMMWNTCRGGREPDAFGAPLDAELERLMQILARSRTTRWAADEFEFEVEDLEVHTEDGEMVFTFRLTWDEGESFWPCEIVVDQPVLPSALN